MKEIFKYWLSLPVSIIKTVHVFYQFSSGASINVTYFHLFSDFVLRLAIKMCNILAWHFRAYPEFLFDKNALIYNVVKLKYSVTLDVMLWYGDLNSY